MGFKAYPSRFDVGVEMRKVILVILLSSVCSGAMAEWVRVAGNAEGTTYADPSSISKNGNMAKMWVLNDFKTAMAEGNAKPYLSMKRHQEYDCKAGQLRSLAITVHTGSMGGGSMVHSGADDMQWLPIRSGSIREATWKFACGI